ncbi:SGNH/GDSL hydrolase family protein [Ramlibacter sp.]|uniref:SGNH/GDSL hydrolase family protein n=1 Tax=Ramlibacter sp. TaxID=1917967 RepID=UPI00184111D5|nr:SGNH/GDSL hydrolase family protein [Ramlibacter sp.]MBA2673064.1 GDSL family lipase [Ramlibacter sp.]
MARLWLRRAALWAATASALLLAACGSGSIESQLHPSRMVVFGDAFADIGQTGTRYTVNDGSINNWTLQLASRFGITLAPAVGGGLNYATGTARITAKPDAAGNGATRTVKEQVDAFLAAGNALQSNDLVVLNAGIGDITAEVGQFNGGTETRDQMIADVKQAGSDLGAQVRRLVAAGATHVVVVGSYNLSKSPWARQTAQQPLLEEASLRFNDQLLLSIVDLGANVLYVDLALYYNLVVATPTGYEMTNSTDPVCISVDPGPGIGTGAGQVNSALCTPATVGGQNAFSFVFADRLYPTPHAHRLFGDYAYDRIRQRW